MTDTPARAERLARELEPFAACTVVDVIDPDQRHCPLPVTSLRAIVSDTSLSQSATIAGLRHHLDRVKPRRLPHLCLLQEDTSRAHAQADALGATRTLPATCLLGQLLGALTEVTGPFASTRADARTHADAARTTLSRLFKAGFDTGAVDHKLVAIGTEYIEAAVKDAGIRAWLDVVWQFDDLTHQHCLLVSGLAAGFARALGLRDADCRRLTQAAVLHDVGKAKVPPEILNKAGPLTPQERAIMNLHPAHGHAMLRSSGFADEMLAVVRSHHEALDGSGYPDGLRGGQIPDLVRLVSVCDVYAALIERRPYKAPMRAERAYSLLESMAGKLDADLVRAFRPFAAAAQPLPPGAP